MNLFESYEMKRRSIIRKVLDCGSPLPLFHREPCVTQRQRAAAVQDAAAQFSISSHFQKQTSIFCEH
jgi:hypothetical protein